MIIIREIVISGFREALANYNKSNILNVTFLSKIKTTSQFIAIFILTLMPLSLEYSLKIHQIGTLLLYISAILTVSTGYNYVIKSIIALKNIEKEKNAN